MVKSIIIELPVEKFRQLVEKKIINLTVEKHGDGGEMNFPMYNKAIGTPELKPFMPIKKKGIAFNHFIGNIYDAGRYLEGTFELKDIKKVIE